MKPPKEFMTEWLIDNEINEDEPWEDREVCQLMQDYANQSKWISAEDELPEPTSKDKYLADTGKRVYCCGFKDKDAGIWPNVKQWCIAPEPPKP